MISQSFKLEKHPEFDWSDINPISQSYYPIMNINYPEYYEKLMNIFRRIIRNLEISERVFYLTEEILRRCSGNYVAWNIRRKCLEELNLDKENESIMINNMIKKNSKNYQLWEHKRYVGSKINNPNKELEFIKLLLEEDDRNIHIWNFRIWLLESNDLYITEENNIKDEISNNILNGSAWHYLSVIAKKKTNADYLCDLIEYCFKILEEKYENEAAWNFLNSWFHFRNFGEKNLSTSEKVKFPFKFEYKDFGQVEKFCRRLRDNKTNNSFSDLTLINILYWREEITEIKEIFEGIMKIENSPHYKYWEWMKINIIRDCEEKGL